MSLQWNLVAGLLYSELALTILLLIPHISNRFWNRTLHWPFLRYHSYFLVFSISPFLRNLEKQSVYYFYVVVAVLLLAFLDSIREMQKYATRDHNVKEVIFHANSLDKHKILFFMKSGMKTLELEMMQQMKLFRSQRNFYIVGFTLFLSLVIKRLLQLVVSNDDLQVKL